MDAAGPSGVWIRSDIMPTMGSLIASQILRDREDDADQERVQACDVGEEIEQEEGHDAR